MPTISKRRLRHVNSYLTPLAVAVVVPGLAFGEMPGAVRASCGGLIAFSAAVIVLTAGVLKNDAGTLSKLRVGTNYAVNVLLLLMLYPYWPMVWALMLLMAYGLAVYQSPGEAFKSACAIALFLLFVHGTVGILTVEEWAVVGIKAAIIIVSAPFISGLRDLNAPHA